MEVYKEITYKKPNENQNKGLSLIAALAVAIGKLAKINGDKSKKFISKKG